MDRDLFVRKLTGQKAGEKEVTEEWKKGSEVGKSLPYFLSLSSTLFLVILISYHVPTAFAVNVKILQCQLLSSKFLLPSSKGSSSSGGQVVPRHWLLLLFRGLEVGSLDYTEKPPSRPPAALQGLCELLCLATFLLELFPLDQHDTQHDAPCAEVRRRGDISKVDSTFL